MTVDEITRLETPPPPVRPPAFRGWRVAVAAAVAAVALVAGFVLVGNSGEEAAGVTDLEVAEQFMADFEAGDVAKYEALVDAGAYYPPVVGVPGDSGGPYFGPLSVIWAEVSHFFAATGSVTFTCQPVESAAQSAIALAQGRHNGGVDALCESVGTNVFRDLAGLGPNTTVWSFVIEDGTIVELYGLVTGGPLRLPAEEIAAYDQWLQANYPRERADLMALNSELFEPDILAAYTRYGQKAPAEEVFLDLGTPEQRARHAELAAEWAAGLSQ